MAENGRNTSADARFVERMGHLLEADGLTRITGRILGHLLLSTEPQSLEDLSVALKASKGSISQDTRTLERLGALERVTRPGDRRVYYHIGDRMMERMVALRLERFEQLREALDEVLRTGAAKDDGVRARLREFIGFHDYLLVTIREARDKWCRQNTGTEK